jgi:glycosyltransferase involved in cell wall biosynthesis
MLNPGMAETDEGAARDLPPPAGRPYVSVVIMAWNEAATLATVAREIHDALVATAASFEILVIDDGSSDGTGPLADELARALPGLRVCHHAENRGLGEVYRTAFAHARGELLTFFPADGQFPASIIGQYLPVMADADMILGVLPERRGPVSARLLSAGERLLLRVLFGHFPRFQGILMFRRALLPGTPLRSQGRGWTVLMELILRQARAGARIQNLPITIRPRQSGRSKVNNLRSILSNLRQVLALRLHL